MLGKNIDENLKNNGEKVCSLIFLVRFEFNWTSVSFDRVQESNPTCSALKQPLQVWENRERRRTTTWSKLV